MEESKMANEKKTLVKNFKVVIEDLLDNYEQYTDEEKDQIKAIFQQVADLNSVLDKYDVKSKFDLQEYLTALGRCFEAFHY